MSIPIAVPLDVPEVRVLASRVLEEGTLLIEVESTLQTAQCPRCGREIDRFHGVDRPIWLRHRPVFGHEALIEIRPKRYRCPHGDGGPTTTQRCPWYDLNRPHTNAFEAEVLKRLVHSTVADVSRPLDLGVKAVAGIVDHPVAPAVDWGACTALETLGIDEVAPCKGQGHYGAVVWAQRAGTHPCADGVAGPAPSHGAGLSERYPPRLESHGAAGWYRRWEGYAGAVAAALPQARLVVDRFHVAVHYREAMDHLRKQEFHRLDAERGPANARPTAELRRLLRPEWPSPNPAQQGQRVELFEQTPTLASAYVLRTTLTAIFECTPDRPTAQTRLRMWTEQVKAAGITCFDKFLNTSHNWQDGILNYFLL